MERFLNVTEARASLLDLVDRLRGSDRVIITKRGRPKAVLVEYERLMLLDDLAWLLQNPSRRDSLARGWRELEEGRTIAPPRNAKPNVATLRRMLHSAPRKRAKA